RDRSSVGDDLVIASGGVHFWLRRAIGGVRQVGDLGALVIEVQVSLAALGIDDRKTSRVVERELVCRCNYDWRSRTLYLDTLAEGAAREQEDSRKSQHRSSHPHFSFCCFGLYIPTKPSL